MRYKGHVLSTTLTLLAAIFTYSFFLDAARVEACPWQQSRHLLGEWLPHPTIPGKTPGEIDRAIRKNTAGTQTVSVSVNAPPSVVGRWLAPQPWPVIAIHAALLPSGKVMHYSYPAGGGAGSDAKIWNPRSGTFEPTTVDTDIFCSGLTFLADGRLYATGGNDYSCDFQGRNVTHTFDPRTKIWERQDDMSVGRWYPTNVTLGTGDVLILSGLDQTCALTPVMELFSPTQGLQEIPEGNRLLELYPRLHLLSSGRIAHVGPEDVTRTFDMDTRTWQFVDRTNAGYRWDGTSALVPGKTDEIIACGGSDGGSVTDTCERIDFQDPSPQWEPTGSMNFPRSHGNVLTLPDRTILMVGGGIDGLYGDPVHNAELYDPDTEAWTLLPPQAYGRMYHSTTVLLPDGRVLSAGQDSGESANFGQIYMPPYLFKGSRPRISAVQRQIRYGENIIIDTPNADAIESIALIRLTTVTHSVNNSQRYVGLNFTSAGQTEIMATTPINPNLAPPGHYMLFIVNGNGVPSIARIVRLI